MLLTDDVLVSHDSTFDFSNCAKFMINSTTNGTSIQLGRVWFQKTFVVAADSIELNGNVSVWN